MYNTISCVKDLIGFCWLFCSPWAPLAVDWYLTSEVPHLWVLVR